MEQYKEINNDIGIAIDVGSTSVGICCLNLKNKMELFSFSFSNPQHIYGADIVTRIKHCITNDSMINKMHEILENAIYTQLKAHLKDDFQRISKIVYSGNTTMFHFLREFQVYGLSKSPFSPISLEYYENRVTKIDNENVIHIFLPGVSAFVGSDILSGVHYLQMGKTDSYELLIDLGTNGELFLINNKKGFATSTACGPVFDHAVRGAKYGSESMKIIANCVKRGLIDKTGKITDVFFENGIDIEKDFIVTQENVRNFQLAKGAIYAGICCLLKQARITASEVSKIYISGGFGFYMNPKDAFLLKMFPYEFRDKIIISGNTSLEGAKEFLLLHDLEKERILTEYQELRQRTHSFELSNIDDFQDCYINSLNF